jgi:hypothetical protein
MSAIKRWLDGVLAVVEDAVIIVAVMLFLAFANFGGENWDEVDEGIGPEKAP